MKRLLILLLFIGVIGGSGYIAVLKFGEEKLNPAIASLYAMDKKSYATNDNGYLGMMGVYAPADTADTYAWALQWAESHLTSINPAPWDSVPGKLLPTGDIRTIDCWVDRKWPDMSNPSTPSCNNPQGTVDLLNANYTLLKRYHAQFHYNRFIDVPYLGLPFGASMIDTHTLFLAYLVNISPVHPEVALEEWMKSAIFLKKALADQNSLFTRSILMIMYAQSQKALPELLAADATLAKKYETQLLQILTPFGTKQMNMPAVIKADYLLLGDTIRQFSPHNQNKFYQFEQDQLLAIAHTPPLQINAAHAAFMKTYGNPPRPANMTDDDFQTLTPEEIKEKMGEDAMMDLIIGGGVIGSELFKVMAALDARNRMLNLYVQMRAKNLPGDQIAAFIHAAPASLQDPFTEQPFRYDAARKLIYFSMPEMPEYLHALLLW